MRGLGKKSKKFALDSQYNRFIPRGEGERQPPSERGAQSEIEDADCLGFWRVAWVKDDLHTQRELASVGYLEAVKGLEDCFGP